MHAAPPNRNRARLVVVAVLAIAASGYVVLPVLIRGFVDARIAAVHGRTLDFELKDTAGVVHRSADLRGKTVILSFFRSNCGSCVAERDAVRAFAERLDPDRAVLLGVLTDPVEGYPPDVTAATLARMDYRHPVLLADASFVDAFHGAGWAHVTPITYVADASGVIVRELRGTQTLDALLAAVPAEDLRKP